MRMVFKTLVATDFKTVFEKFDISLFKALKPPLIQLEVERFDGCLKGDQVHLKIGLGPLEQRWVSLITENGSDENQCYFIDEGETLPPPLKCWRHQHRIVKNDEYTSYIIDDIEFSSGLKLLDFLLYPALYFQFALRAPVYRKIFGKAKV
jgi:ligand-binding SRPBCC domain-containing protein